MESKNDTCFINSERGNFTDNEMNLKLLDLVTQMHNLNAIETNKDKVFYELLRNILILTQSECGYFGEVFYENKIPKLFCKILMMSPDDTYENICDIYQSGLVFQIPDKIYGIPYYTKEPYMTNDLNKTLKEKHLGRHCVIQNLTNYCTLPLIFNNKVIGMIGLGNRKNGFDAHCREIFMKYFDCCSIILQSKITYENELILELISQSQKSYIQNNSPYDIFTNLLNGILDFTKSEYGFIGEVLFDIQGIPYLKTMAITNIAWNDRLKNQLDKKESVIFKNLNTLFGLVMTSQKLIISDNPSIDPRRGGKSKLPKGHPPLRKFCGIPFFMPDKQFIGMIGLANSPIDYHSDISQKLDPLLNTCALLVNSIRLKILKEEAIAIDMKYMSQISHELKTPLNAILGFSQLLQTQSESKYVKYIIESSQLLMEIINNSLNLNRLDNYSINNQYIPLHKSINRYLLEHDINISKMGLKIKNNIPTNLMVFCDKFLFERILRNLISNAIKYNVGSGYIEFSCIQKETLYITIKNSGTLLIDEDKLFKPFQTSDSQRGTGLGLSITKKIFNIINMKIYCKTGLDDNGEFVSFIFNLNYKNTITEKIVYLEDNRMNQLLMENILADQDLTIKSDAVNLLDYIQDYDILLLDLFLNHVNGFDVMDILQKENIHIPIIVITADTNPNTLEKLHKKNIKYFTKPINITDFLEFMNSTFFNVVQ